MIWLEASAGLTVAALVLVRWLGSHLTLVWRYAPPSRPSVTTTVVRPVPSPRPVPGSQTELSPGQRIIRGELER